MPKSRILAKSGIVVLVDEDDVLGLHISVDDASVVRARQRAQHMPPNVQRPLPLDARPSVSMRSKRETPSSTSSTM